MLIVLFCCLLTCCVQAQQSDLQVYCSSVAATGESGDIIYNCTLNTRLTFLDMNPALKTLTSNNLGYELVDGWMGRYKLHTDVQNWFDAQEVCAQEGANLLVINSRKEATAMRSLVEKTGNTRMYYWLGFHDMYEEGNYVTIFNESLNSTGYAEWGNQEPHVRAGEHCGVWGNFSQKYGLGNFFCSVDQPYICEEETVVKQKTIPTKEENSSLEGYEYIPSLGFYKVYQYSAEWQEAVDICAQEEAHLLILNSEEEQTAVVSLLNAINYCCTWTGVTDQYQEGNYVTIFNDTLQSTGYTNWGPDQPTGGREMNCVVFEDYSSMEVGLDDYPCTYARYFICEHDL